MHADESAGLRGLHRPVSMEATQQPIVQYRSNEIAGSDSQNGSYGAYSDRNCRPPRSAALHELYWASLTITGHPSAWFVVE